MTLPLPPRWESEEIVYVLGWRSRLAVLWTGVVRVVRA